MFRHRDASDFSAEIEAHVQLEADRLEELGFSPEDARTAALRTFGNMTRVRERWYESGRCVWLEDCWQDLRYALRILLKNPAFSLVAVLTLTLGVGANTAMFSIVNAVLFRPIPFRDSQQLVRVFFNDPRLGLRDMPASKPELDDLLTRADVFQDATPVGGGSVNLTGAATARVYRYLSFVLCDARCPAANWPAFRTAGCGCRFFAGRCDQRFALASLVRRRSQCHWPHCATR